LPIARPLQVRLATAGALIPLIVAAVVLLPAPAFAAFVGVVVCWAAFEWAGLLGLGSVPARASYVGAMAASLALWWRYAGPAWDLPLLMLGSLWWVAVVPVLLRITPLKRRAGVDVGLLPLGLLVLVPPWVALVRLHEAGAQGPWLVMGLLMLIWIADSAAYFVGRQFGRRRLAPALSPGKTWAGVYGALAGAALWGALLAFLLSWPIQGSALLVVLCVAVAAVSIVGDLFESLLKRRRDLKDTGHLLPGHGGMLDRIDSLTAAAPLFVLGFVWLKGVV